MLETGEKLISPLPDHIDVGGESLPIAEIHKAFAESEYGRSLHQTVRFERYKPEHLSDGEWLSILGADVNNLTHMTLTRGLTAAFIRHAPADEYSSDEQALLLATATIHDWGEALVGDISYDHKTSSDESEEFMALETIASDVLGEQGKGLIKRVIPVLQDRHSKLGRSFNIIEKIGYMRTAIRSWLEADAQPSNSAALHLKWLSNNVFVNHVDKLVDASGEFPQIKQFFYAYADDITEIFEHMPEAAFSYYEDEAQRTKDFKRQANVWYDYLQTGVSHGRL